MSHEEHMKQMAKEAMGFDQDKVIHHFKLLRSGGIIEVSAKDTQDETTRRQIRDHLTTVAKEFAEGEFKAPVATHAEVPPGVPEMRSRKDRIQYRYEETSNGGQVVIATKDRKALAAVHEFLKYQIREHATGDPVTVEQ